MASNATVTVGSTPTILYQSNGPQVETIMITVAGAAITLGGKDVVAGAGPVLPVSAVPVAITINEDTLYAITATGSATVQLAAWLSGPNT